ncbi:MAG: biopolymer transporter ExbD [Halobacteriovoraceae bacterium]|nr:biopolymer transporter ExbD [Halobacteriovoraceae bacterium]MCB9094126.1 biopolymer transporter ExbD [Halobacteriovoraceae bacterium]
MARSSFLNQGRRSAPKLNITSLMDALTIILIFLLVNYSEVSEESDFPDFIVMPQIEGAPKKAEMGVIMVVGETQIKIGKEDPIHFRNFEQEEEQVLNKIYDKLEIIKENILKRTVASEKDKKIRISIQADQGIPYKTIDRIVRKASELSLNYVDFIAMNKED